MSIRKLVLAMLFLLPTLSFAGIPPEKDVRDAYYTWCSTIGSAKGNPDAILKLYDEHAVLLPTFSSKILTGHKSLKGYFTKLLSHPNIRCKAEELHTRLYEDTAINYGVYEFTYDENGHKKEVPARFTFVYEDVNGKLKIVYHHSSVMPE